MRFLLPAALAAVLLAAALPAYADGMQYFDPYGRPSNIPDVNAPGTYRGYVGLAPWQEYLICRKNILAAEPDFPKSTLDAAVATCVAAYH
jgi:hypothetical protein